jgi:hypothetical protein
MSGQPHFDPLVSRAHTPGVDEDAGHEPAGRDRETGDRGETGENRRQKDEDWMGPADRTREPFGRPARPGLEERNRSPVLPEIGVVPVRLGRFFVGGRNRRSH